MFMYYTIIRYRKNYLLPQGIQASGFMTVFAAKLWPLAVFEFRVYPPIFGLGLHIASDSDSEVKISAWGAVGC